MRIGILGPITWRTPPKGYGPWEQVVAHLADGLVRRGHEVVLFATGDSRTTARLEWVAPRPLGEAPELDPDLFELLHIAHAFRLADQVDLIHSHLNWRPAALHELCPVPLVTTLHGAALLEPKSRAIFRQLAHLPYVAISEAERSGVPELNYLATVPNGVAVEEFPFSPEPGRYLLHLGRICADKGSDLAIDLAEAAGLPLVIAGPVFPGDRAFFEEKIRPRCDGQRIQYVGPVDARRRNELMAGALALVHLIRFPEPFGLVLAEAQACGTPVLGFRRGAVPEVVEDGVTGFVVDSLEEAVARAPQLAGLDRAACRERVRRHFSVERMVEGYERVYEQLLRSP